MITDLLRDLERRTRPVHPESRAAMDARWAGLPDHVKTPNQLLGRSAVGCEGTHGVFPKCNLTCTPCYHSAEANQVRVDGGHTLREVERQMQYLRSVRGPRAHAQLIGGEVSLLDPDDHAAALAVMRANGREPMSMTHGDFDYAYLLALVLDAKGERRFDRVSFAAHFDSLMRGRRGAVRPRSEAELDPFRSKFARMFADLQQEHGVRSYLAHNMTVTPSNLEEVAGVTRSVLSMPYNMLSFQPAAFIGDNRRWKEDFAEVRIDDVWEQIEKGAGQELPWRGTQFGDPRCNRYTTGLSAAGTFAVAIDPAIPADTAARDRLLKHHGGMFFGGQTRFVLAARILRAAARYPGDVAVLLKMGQRIIARAGGARALWHAWRGKTLAVKTFVVHNFMDASVVAPAWALIEQGQISDDPAVREAQERLGACMYTMSHPETGQLVPACTQHSVLDSTENKQLLKLLPLRVKTN
ncbi:hypothetical protein [Arthrobacter sp. H41]|uniref:hypothetical protein n=1 Tax=Arthrobacter sp. H41 TaxID=1312978 RepID=UPI001C1E72D6|nr:hypothetical protein [Arthrobacter sp. H41]